MKATAKGRWKQSRNGVPKPATVGTAANLAEKTVELDLTEADDSLHSLCLSFSPEEALKLAAQLKYCAAKFPQAR